jgi:hypothetical protein
MLRKITSILTAAVLATGISIATAAPSSAITISDGSTVSLVSTAPLMTSCQTTLTSISATTRVRNWTSGDNIDFSFVGAASFVWGSTHDAAFTQALNNASATRGTFTPVTGTTYTFYRLREGTTSANYFCRPGEVNLLVNGTDAITGWVVSPTTFFTSGGSTGSSNSAAQAAAIEAERVRQAAIAAAQVVLQGLLKGDKPGTMAQYKEADFTVSSEAALVRVNAALLKLPADLRVKNEEIAKVVKIENLVDQISTTATQKQVTVTQLIATGFIAKENNNKSILTYLLKNRDASTLGSKENIAAAIAEETEAIKARAARLAAIKAKIAARNK